MSEHSCYYYDSEHNRCHCFDNDAEMTVDELSKRIDALECRMEALEKRCGKIAAFSYGDNDRRIKKHERRIKKHERRIEHIERLLNHKGGGE